jgi:hypothetical protein
MPVFLGNATFSVEVAVPHPFYDDLVVHEIGPVLDDREHSPYFLNPGAIPNLALYQQHVARSLFMSEENDPGIKDNSPPPEEDTTPPVNDIESSAEFVTLCQEATAATILKSMTPKKPAKVKTQPKGSVGKARRTRLVQPRVTRVIKTKVVKLTKPSADTSLLRIIYILQRTGTGKTRTLTQDSPLTNRC